MVRASTSQDPAEQSGDNWCLLKLCRCPLRQHTQLAGCCLAVGSAQTLQLDPYRLRRGGPSHGWHEWRGPHLPRRRKRRALKGAGSRIASPSPSPTFLGPIRPSRCVLAAAGTTTSSSQAWSSFGSKAQSYTRATMSGYSVSSNVWPGRPMPRDQTDATESRRKPTRRDPEPDRSLQPRRTPGAGSIFVPAPATGTLSRRMPGSVPFQKHPCTRELPGAQLLLTTRHEPDKNPDTKNSYRAHIMRCCAFSTRRLAKLPPSFRSFLEPDRKADPLTVRRLESQARKPTKLQ